MGGQKKGVPARAALALVLDGRDSALGAPVDAVDGCVWQPRFEPLGKRSHRARVDLAKLLVGQVGEVVHTDTVCLRCVCVVLADALQRLGKDAGAVGTLLGRRVRLAKGDLKLLKGHLRRAGMGGMGQRESCDSQQRQHTTPSLHLSLLLMAQDRKNGHECARNGSEGDGE
jgi:hypothetical protein